MWTELYNFISVCIIIFSLTGVECNIVLKQTNSIVLQPGHSLTLTCEVSGYSVTDGSYATAWIDILQEKLWSGLCTYGEMEHLCKSDSSNTVTLKGQNLKTEDTAVYYCARHPQHEKTAQALYMNYYSQHPLYLIEIQASKSYLTQVMICKYSP
uniref:Ig-like domain-containing protein n=1 Tax=Sinocyclocheilus anshuiensis TaxID=1608454 RepID=A0A671QNL9_9TELE